MSEIIKKLSLSRLSRCAEAGGTKRRGVFAVFVDSSKLCNKPVIETGYKK